MSIAEFIMTGGRSALEPYRQRKQARELQVIEATTQPNTPARIQAVTEWAKKNGLSIPPGLEAHTPIPTELDKAHTEAERSRGEYYKAGAARRGGGELGLSELNDLGETYAKVSGNLPTDPNDPAYAAGSKILERIDKALSSLNNEVPSPGQGGPTPMGGQGAPAKVEPEVRTGSALSAIQPMESPNAWRARVRGDRSQEQAGQPALQQVPAVPFLNQEAGPSAQQTPRPGGWLSKLLAGSASPGMSASHVMGNPLAAEQVNNALTQYEGAGGVTTRNAGKVQQSQAATTDALKAAARAVKAYKATPDYIQMCHDTGRLLNETDLSGQMKEVLAKESSADQKRLLKLIHKHGEAKVLQQIAGSAKPEGDF